MRGRARRLLWIAMALGWGLSPLAAMACGDQAPDDSNDGSAGAGGGTSDEGGGNGGLGGRPGDGDGGTAGGARDGGAGSGGRSGSGGGSGSGGTVAVPDCLDDLIDDSCEVAVREAVDGWNCGLRFPKDSLSAEDGA